MQLSTRGLIIKEQNIGEQDKLVTVLTEDRGVIRAFVRQGKNIKSKNAAATALLSYSEFRIYQSKDRYIIDSAELLELFYDLRRDIEKLALAQYFCELASFYAPQDTPSHDFLRLLLNSIYLVTKGQKPNKIIKAAFEMRLLSMAGYMPDLLACRHCGAYESTIMYLLVEEGALVCSNCYPGGSTALALSKGVLTALRHTIYADFSKLFSFDLPVPAQEQLAHVAEHYVKNQSDRTFQTLEFYHTVESIS